MNTCFIRNARIYHTPTRSFCEGAILVEKGRIAALYTGGDVTPPADVPAYDAEGRRIIPGLVDVHTHGRAGGDFGTADLPLMRRMAKSYLDSGVTERLELSILRTCQRDRRVQPQQDALLRANRSRA